MDKKQEMVERSKEKGFSIQKANGSNLTIAA